MRVLAIETSCDETAAAVIEGVGPVRGRASNGVGGRVLGVGTPMGVRVLSSVVASQADLHARTAGVVPEVAARAHVEAMMFVVDDALRRGMGSRELGVGTIDAVAATTEPGLRPALVIGETAGRALAAAWEKPFLPVNHLAGHLAAAWLVSDLQPAVAHRFPAVALIASGGHTQLWKLDRLLPTTSASPEPHDGWQLCLLGQTRDDAAGEAFDKIARLLGLPYPGGAALAQLAEHGDVRAFPFPRPMINSGDSDLSFSGLKTAVFYHARGRQLTDDERANVAASAQEAIVDVLVVKTVEAAAREGAAEIILTGGVAANKRLRFRFQEALGSLPLIVPPSDYCTDNAAMVGAAAVLGLRIPERMTTE